jgi:hypothetical protein
MSQAYEIELVTSNGHDYWESLFATLTGLDKVEVWNRLPANIREARSWGGANFVQAARALGFNCNPRFIKFDPATPWPCILRCKPVDKECRWWYSRVYHQGSVYQVGGQRPLIQKLEYFLRDNPQFRITSMLQVWMGHNTVLLPSEQ